MRLGDSFSPHRLGYHEALTHEVGIMSIQYDPKKMYQTAGIHALSWPESSISPHRLLIEKERAHVDSMVQGSLKGLIELTAKAAYSVEVFDALSAVLREGERYFYPANNAPQRPTEETLSLRRQMYILGKRDGFEKIDKNIRRYFPDPVVVEGESYAKRDLLQCLSECGALERRRIDALHRVSRSFDDCFQRLSKDPLLQKTLCSMGGIEDVEKFVRARRDEARQCVAKLFEWSNGITESQEAFGAHFKFDGWLKSLGAMNRFFADLPPGQLPQTLSMAEALTPKRKETLARAVNVLLDDLVPVARKYTTFRESAIKELFRVHFHLLEMEKELPAEIEEYHRERLEAATDRFLKYSDSVLYILGVEGDTGLSNFEREILTRHLVTAYDELHGTESAAQREVARADMMKRTQVRRELKANLEEEREQLKFDELMSRITEIKSESAPVARVKEGATLRFYPERLKEEFSVWVAPLPEQAQASAYDLLDSAVKGERVDFKPINTEKKMFELRLVGCGYRIYCTRTKLNQLVVLGFGPKESQRHNIATAKERFRQLQAQGEV